MPVWPFLMAAAAGLTVWGYFRNAWEAPFVMLCAYVATRIVVSATPQQFVEVSICALWLCAGRFLVYRGYATPGLLLTFSALTYPVLLVFGVRLEYMSLVPIVADGLAVCAMISIGRGIHGSHHNSRNVHRCSGMPRALVWMAHNPARVAQDCGNHSKANQVGAQRG